jgi:hypothetical protein
VSPGGPRRSLSRYHCAWLVPTTTEYRNHNPEIPVTDPKKALHPKALKLLVVGKRIIETKGLNAATLEAISAEAGVNKAATR